MSSSSVSTLTPLLLLALPFVRSDNVLYLSSLTCNSSYPVVVDDVEFQCEDDCALGANANFTAYLSYTNLTSEELFTTSVMNFTASYSDGTGTGYQSSQVSNAGFSQQLTLAELVDVCESDSATSDCPYDDNSYSVKYEYAVPSTGNLDWYFDGFELESNIRIFDYKYDMDLLGDCMLTLTTEAPKDVSSVVYDAISSNGSTYLYYAAAAIVLGAAAYVLHGRNKKEDDDEKVESLLYRNHSEFSEPDEIERGRSVLKRNNQVFGMAKEYPQGEEAAAEPQTTEEPVIEFESEDDSHKLEKVVEVPSGDEPSEDEPNEDEPNEDEPNENDQDQGSEHDFFSKREMESKERTETFMTGGDIHTKTQKETRETLVTKEEIPWPGSSVDPSESTEDGIQCTEIQ